MTIKTLEPVSLFGETTGQNSRDFILDKIVVGDSKYISWLLQLKVGRGTLNLFWVLRGEQMDFISVYVRSLRATNGIFSNRFNKQRRLVSVVLRTLGLQPIWKEEGGSGTRSRVGIGLDTYHWWLTSDQSPFCKRIDERLVLRRGVV